MQTEYRRNVGVVLLSEVGSLFWAKRVDQESAWQFPQGGVDSGETLETALFRELQEEVGLDHKDAQVIARTKDWLSYTIPTEYQAYDKGKVYRGQRQKWFLVQLITEPSRICLNRMSKQVQPEFSQWRWVNYWYPVEHIVAFKRAVYRTVLSEFSAIVSRM